MLSSLGHADHLVDGARHGALHVNNALPRRGLEVFLTRPAEAARQPTAVAPRGSKAGEFALDDCNA